MTDNNGTKRRRPTPSKAAARTASATASSPLTKAAKSRTNALAYRSRPDSVGPDPIPSIDRYCRADGYRRDLAWSATSQIPFCGKTPFELSSINRVPQPEASRATPNRGRPGINVRPAWTADRSWRPARPDRGAACKSAVPAWSAIWRSTRAAES